ncbi:MAG: hypothetical protein HZB54_03910 [Deltaproteobacteria bacterium]|nr:hypothetical protein [Deltaproteobacteria bacterium]
MSEPFYSPFVRTLFKKISHAPEFEKDMKRLKRFSSIEEDLRWKGIDSAGMGKGKGVGVARGRGIDQARIFCFSYRISWYFDI